MKELCICCKKREIQIKKRKLCGKCYGIKRYRRELVTNTLTTKGRIVFKAEMDFVQSYFTHNNWLYQPANFRVGDSYYRPDFYDKERNVFIEVVGTRQAFHHNKEKYLAFRQAFPLLTFEIRAADGTLIDLDQPRQGWAKENL